MGRLRHSRFGTLALGCALSLGASRATAQGRFELHPRLGIYFSPGVLLATYEPSSGQVVRRRQLMSPTLGIGATLWAAKYLAVEGAAIYAPSMVAITDSQRTQDATSGVVLASLRTTFGLRRPTEGWSLYGGPGVGLIHRGGAARGSRAGDTRPALLPAAGGRLALKNSPSFTVEVASYSSWTNSGAEPSGTGRRRWHQDVVWSWGLAIPVAFE